MRKKIFIIIAIWLVSSLIFGIVYTIKSTPKPKYPPILHEGKTAKEPFKSIGTKMAEVALKNRNKKLTPFFKKLNEAGATDVKLQIEINKSPVEKTLPPVIIGKKAYKKKTECAIITYTYNKEKYVVGTCR